MRSLDARLPLGIARRRASTATGLDVHYLEAGAGADRPLALLLHGVPELAFSWRKVMPALAEAGLWVVAPDQRGDGATTGADVSYSAPLEQSATPSLTADALGASWDVWAHRHANMELYGEDASLFVPDPNFFGGTVEIGGQDSEIKPLPAWDHPFGVSNQGDLANYRCAGLADMAAAIDEGRAHRCNVDLAVHAVDVMTSILKAGEERRFVDLTTTCDRPAALSPDEARALLA